MTGNIFVAAKAALIGCVFVVIYYGVLIKIINYCGLVERYKMRKRKELTLIGIFYIVLIIYFCWLVSQGNDILFWDRGFYWLKTLNFQDVLMSETGSVLKHIYESVNLTDYSDVVSAIMSPFLFLGSDSSYIVFRVQLFIMFQVPSYLVFGDIINVILSKIHMNECPYSYLISNILCACLTFMYLPTLYGLFDIADFFVASCIILLLSCKDYCTFSWKFCFYLSSLFLMLLFLRRHFAFFALGYFLFFIVVTFIEVLWHKDKKRLCGLIKNSIVVGTVCLLVLVLFFRQYLIRTLDNSYAVEYSARSYGTMFDKYVDSFEVVGWGILVLSVIGVFALFKRNKKQIAIIQVASVLFIMWMFFRIQSLSCQHYYNFAGQIMILNGVGFFALYSFFKKKGNLFIFSGLLVVFLQFMNGLVPKVNISSGQIFSSICYEPVYRNDINEIERLVDDLNAYTRKDNNKIYCVCSSGIINEDILLNVNLPEQRYAVNNLATTLHTDMAGGFPVDFLDADYIVASNPSQIHANKDGQRIIWALNDLLINKSVLNDNYRVVGTYELDEGVEVFVYEKVKKLTKEDYECLINMFDEWYSDYSDIFHERIVNFEIEKGGN